MSGVQKALVGIFCVFLIIMFVNSYSGNMEKNPSAAESYRKMIEYDIQKTYEDVKKKTPGLKIVNIEEFQGEKSKYALVEVKYHNDLPSRIELVDLKNKVRELLPIDSDSTLKEIKNENHIEFISNREYPDGARSFPYISKCIRVGNDDPLGEEEGNFIVIREDVYLNINQRAEYGSVNDSSAYIAKIVPTLDGVQILYNYDSMADSETCPKTKIHYNDKDNQLILEIEKCKVSDMYNVGREMEVADSLYVKSINLNENENSCKVAIQIKNDTMEYTVKTGMIKAGFPYSELKFRIQE